MATPTRPPAAALLRSVLEGLDELFAQTGVPYWRGRVREVAAADSPSSMARAYESMQEGSAPGTFHDLVMSAHNRNTVTQRAEPYVNELLETFQSLGLATTQAIKRGGDNARMASSTPDLASQYVLALRGSDAPSRRRIVVTGVRCTTCNTSYQLDDAAHRVAARKWSWTTAPEWVDAGRSRELVAAAMQPLDHRETRTQFDEVRPAFQRPGHPTIRLPYNRPSGAPNDQCRVCGADAWTTTHWLFVDDPPRLQDLTP